MCVGPLLGVVGRLSESMDPACTRLQAFCVTSSPRDTRISSRYFRTASNAIALLVRVDLVNFNVQDEITRVDAYLRKLRQHSQSIHRNQFEPHAKSKGYGKEIAGKERYQQLIEGWLPNLGISKSVALMHKVLAVTRWEI